MKKTVFVSLLAFSSFFGFSQNTQEASVEKSVFGIQTGFLGLFWVHNELKLSNQVALRSEFGFADVGIWLTGDNKTYYLTGLTLALEPRWYYNLNKRVSQGKRIDGNSGNYLSLRASYYSYRNSETDKHNLNHPFIASTWGIRRNISNHFNYEAGLGAGLGYGNDEGRRRITLTPYINLRIGYRF